MINCFFVWICLIIMTIMGIIVCKVIRVNDEFLSQRGILIFPGIGIICTVNLVQILNLWIPVIWIGYLWLLLLLVGMIRFRESVFCYLEAFCKSKKFLLLVCGITILWMIPFLKYTELVSFQIWNNDIIYYLSSMEWLKNHNSLQNVTYDTLHPFYWCAEYMLNRTRTGFDGFGALIMSIFGLEAHEVFSCLGVVFGITIIFHIYYLFSTIFKLPYKIKIMAIIVIALAGRMEELLVYQYLPQLLGISLLLLFLGVVIPFFEEHENIKPGLTAFVLSGIIAVYAEFCAYLVVIYAGILGFHMIKRNRQLWKRGCMEGIIAIILNPIGTYRAIKINLFVLLNVGENMENIDPFNGKMASASGVFAQIFGVTEKNAIILYLFIGLMLFMWGYYIWKIHDKNKYYCLLGIAFWTLYEIYFQIIKYGYGEYKHLISGTVLMLVLSAYIGYCFISEFKKPLIGKIIYGISGCILLFSGGYHIYDNLIDTELYYFDHTLMELKEAVKLIPESETIGISGTPASIHGELYAAKEHPAVILSNNISYFPYSDEASSRYHLYEGDYLKRKSYHNERFVWGNGRFYIIENTDLQVAYYTGFHLGTITDSIDTCDKESSVMIYNYASDTKYFSLAFQTEKVNKKGGKLKLMLEGDIVAFGNTGDYIVTDMLMLNPGENMRLYFYYEGDLSEKEEKTVGFSVKGLKTITYEKKQVEEFNK